MADRCAAHDIEGLQCVGPRVHAGSHASTDAQGQKWFWSIDHGPLTTTQQATKESI